MNAWASGWCWVLRHGRFASARFSRASTAPRAALRPRRFHSCLVHRTACRGCAPGLAGQPRPGRPGGRGTQRRYDAVEPHLRQGLSVREATLAHACWDGPHGQGGRHSECKWGEPMRPSVWHGGRARSSTSSLIGRQLGIPGSWLASRLRCKRRFACLKPSGSQITTPLRPDRLLRGLLLAATCSTGEPEPEPPGASAARFPRTAGGRPSPDVALNVDRDGGALSP